MKKLALMLVAIGLGLLLVAPVFAFGPREGRGPGAEYGNPDYPGCGYHHDVGLKKLNLSDEQKNFLLNINDFNIEARYPDYKFSFHKKCTRKFTTETFNEIKAFYKWLLKQI